MPVIVRNAGQSERGHRRVHAPAPGSVFSGRHLAVVVLLAQWATRSSRGGRFLRRCRHGEVGHAAGRRFRPVSGCRLWV